LDCFEFTQPCTFFLQTCTFNAPWHAYSGSLHAQTASKPELTVELSRRVTATRVAVGDTINERAPGAVVSTLKANEAMEVRRIEIRQCCAGFITGLAEHLEACDGGDPQKIWQCWPTCAR
jgi:hypothetical protein